jgi:hypothetical protein
MVENYFSDLNEKIISFPVEAYKKQFLKEPEDFDISYVFAYSLGYFGFCLAASEVLKNIIIKPSFNHPICHFKYLLSDFEKTSLKKFSNIQKNKFFAKKAYVIKLKKNFFSGKAYVLINSYDDEEINFTIELKLQKINIKMPEILQVLFKEIGEKLFNKKSLKRQYTQKSTQSVPEYLKFATAPFVQELKRLVTCEKDKIFIGENAVFSKKNTNAGNFIYKHNFEKNSYSEIIEQLLKMNDFTVDILNNLVHYLVENSTEPNFEVLLCIDDLIFLRGKKPNINQKGYRGGYKEFQRKEVLEHLNLLANISISFSNYRMPLINEKGKRIYSEFSCESPLICIQPSEKENYFYVKAGEILAMTLKGIGCKTGLIHKKIAEYDYYRYFWEKRAGNYIAWLWRNRQNKADFLVPISVRALLSQIVDIEKLNRPQQTRNRLETALDTLENDGIIKSWEYKFINEDVLTGKNWFSEWTNLKLVIEPPAAIIEEYSRIKKYGQPKRQNFDYLSILKEIKRKDLSQIRLSEDTGIRFENMARILSGKLSPNHNEKRKLQNWLRNQKAQ